MVIYFVTKLLPEWAEALMRKTLSEDAWIEEYPGWLGLFTPEYVDYNKPYVISIKQPV